MSRRRTVRAATAAVALVVLLAGVLIGCIDTEQPGQRPRRPPTAGPQQPQPDPSDPSQPDGDLVLARSTFRVGPAEIVMGPAKHVDSFLNAVEVDGRIRAYVGRGDTYLLEGGSVADLKPTNHKVINRGGREDFDGCGAWLDAVVPDERDPGLLRAWYHAEADCDYANHQTHKSIAYAESRDGGVNFTKVGYPDNQVIRSRTDGVVGERTGRGNMTLVRRGGFYYIYFQDVLPDFKIVTSVARAPVESGGVPGSWRNYTVDEDGRARWTEDALGGEAAALDASIGASSASLHVPSDEVVLARQHPESGGIVLQASADGFEFTELPEPLVPFDPAQIREEWGKGSDGQIFGYVSLVAPDGSRNWTDEFYLFHMYVFPGDEESRYLVRRLVTVEDAPEDGPWSTVALTSYVGAGGDRFASSAPEKAGSEQGAVLGYLLASPGAGRRQVFECSSADGTDRFVSGECGEVPRQDRMIGYAFTEEQDGTVEVFRCESDGDQFASTDSECDGGRVVAELGWVYPPE